MFKLVNLSGNLKWKEKKIPGKTKIFTEQF